jgi:c(7)-type cytochrome triheme protein
MLIFNGIQEFRDFKPQNPDRGREATAKLETKQLPGYPHLPGNLVLSRSKDSPGKVTFSHVDHLMVTDKCTDCHGKQLPIMLEHQLGALEKRDMHSSENCGRCHDGKTVGNECSSCHKEDKQIIKRSLTKQ